MKENRSENLSAFNKLILYYDFNYCDKNKLKYYSTSDFYFVYNCQASKYIDNHQNICVQNDHLKVN